MLVHRSGYCKDRVVTLGSKNMNSTELCSPVLEAFGSTKTLNAKLSYCIFPSVSLKIPENVPEGLSCTHSNLAREIQLRYF